MWDLSRYLGDGVQAVVTGMEQDFTLPQDEEKVFTDAQQHYLSGNGMAAETIFHIRQVHGANVVKVGDLSQMTSGIPEADGIVTNVRGVTLAVRTADCVPVFLYDPVKRSCGLIHAGWRSAQQEILSQALKVMYQSFGTYPADLHVVFGPAIHSCCYQVGQEFCAFFPEQMIPREGDWFLDLQAVNRQQLINFGVRDEHILDFQRCTCCDDQWFSFRRDGDKAGRHLSLIGIKDNG